MKSIKSKIYLILVVFIFLTVGNSLVSINYFNKLQKSIDSIMLSNYDSVVAAQNMNDAIERQDSIELAFIFEENLSLGSEYESNHMKFLEWFYKAKDNITEDGEAEVISNIEKHYVEYTNKVNKIEKLKSNEGNNSTSRYYYTDVLPCFEILKKECSNLLEINQNSMLTKKLESQRLADKASYSTLGMSMAVLLLGMSIMWYLLNKLIHPLEDLAVGINEVSRGKYEYSMPLNREKEVNYILNDFNIMVSKLREYEQLNINEILREKQKGEAIIESIDSPLIVTDGSNKINMVNKSAERLLDVKEKNIFGRHFLEGIDNRDIFNIIKKSRESIKEYKGVEDIELGEGDLKKYFRVISNPIWFRNEKNIGTVTIMQDITKFKEIDNMKSEFVSTVSHEFRTPLTSIIMAVELLKEEAYEGEEGKKELLDVISDDSDRLNNLVNDLLDLSKMESGKIVMDIKEFDISKTIIEVKKSFKMQLEEKKVGLNIDINGVNRNVKADESKVSWVLANLLGNALRYVDSNGEGLIEIYVKEVNNTMLVSVKDNGEGIEECDQKKIFDKFVQIKSNNKNNSGSSGLGLAICKEIIKANSGDIWVDSIIGVGSTFYFTLKLGGVIYEKDINS
ncbi:MAG: ATP-binding protein [Clostridium paraputrificum]